MNSLDILGDTAPGQPDFCSIAHLSLVRPVLEKITDKWTILILTAVSSEPQRFNAIKRRIGGITHKALSETLKKLERHGMVTRTVLPTSPVGVEYAITPLGRSLREPFYALCTWALAHGGEIDAAAATYDRARETG